MANSNGWGDGAANNSIGWGQGANNNIGWGDSHAKSWAGATDIVGIDSDAQAFITAAAITDPVQINAINTLVEGMKTDGIWTKMKAIYPFVGGTASTHKWNLKDPRDLDAAFRLVFNGGWTHSSNGATPNGTNGYADTKLVPSSVLAQNSTHVSYYSRTNTTTNNGVEIAAWSTTYANGIELGLNRNNQTALIINSSSAVAVRPSAANSQAYFIGNRNAVNSLKFFRNNVSLGTNTTSATTSLTNFALYLGAGNEFGTTAAYSIKQCAFSSIGDGLTDTEAANLYTRVQAFQNSLNRAV